MEYLNAEHVQRIAAEYITKNHTHLAEARVCYLFRTGKWESKGKTVYGTAERVGPKYKMLTGYDFIITINFGVWNLADGYLQEALVDHELSHCGRGLDDKLGNPKWTGEPHSFEDFTGVVRRHGLWTTELKRLVDANKEFLESGQLSIFDVPKTGTED